MKKYSAVSSEKYDAAHGLSQKDEDELYGEIMRFDKVFSMKLPRAGYALGDDTSRVNYKELTAFEELGREILERQGVSSKDLIEYIAGGEGLESISRGHSLYVRTVLGIIGRDYHSHLKQFMPPIGTKAHWIVDLPYIPYTGIEQDEEKYFAAEQSERDGDYIGRKEHTRPEGITARWGASTASLEKFQYGQARIIGMPADRFLAMAGGANEKGMMSEEDWMKDDGGTRRHFFTKWRSGKKKGQYKELSTVDYFKQRILNGEEMSTVGLTYDVARNMMVNHEGRHRARAMLELFREGLVDSPNIPVILTIDGSRATEAAYGKRQSTHKTYHDYIYGTSKMSELAEDPVWYNRLMGNGWKDKNKHNFNLQSGEHFWRGQNAELYPRMREEELLKQVEMHYLRLAETDSHIANGFFGRGSSRLNDMITKWQDETVFGGSIASGKSRWVSIAVDPKNQGRLLGLGSPDAFTDDDVAILGRPVTDIDGKKDFNNSLDKFVKMLEGYPELKKMYEEGEAEIKRHNHIKAAEFHDGKYPILYKGTTFRNAINIFRSGRFVKALRHKNIYQKRGKMMGQDSIYKFFSMTMNPAVAFDRTLPFNGGIVIEFGTEDVIESTKEQEKSGIDFTRGWLEHGEDMPPEYLEDVKIKDRLEEKRNNERLTNDEQEELYRVTYHAGVRDRATGSGRPKRVSGRQLDPVKYTTFPTMMLGNNPEKNVRGIEAIDTDYPANYAPEQEVRGDLGLSNKESIEGIVLDMSDEDFVETLFDEIGLGDFYRDIREHFDSSEIDLESLLHQTKINVIDIPSKASYYKRHEDLMRGYGNDKVSLFEALDGEIDYLLQIFEREKIDRNYNPETKQMDEKHTPIRIRYNFIKSTGSFDMLEFDENGNPDIHWKTYNDLRFGAKGMEVLRQERERNE